PDGRRRLGPRSAPGRSRHPEAGLTVAQRTQRGWARPRPARHSGGGSGPRGAPRAAPVRRVAYDVLAAVDERDAYANLLLPALLRERGIEGRDAALAAQLPHG